MKMSSALESEFTSLHLHSWIDSIFGIDQKEISKFNIYSEICYKNSDVNKEFFEKRSKRFKIKDKNTKNYFKKDVHIKKGNKLYFDSTELRQNQFGRVPDQLFPFSHPKKKIKFMNNKKGNKLNTRKR